MLSECVSLSEVSFLGSSLLQQAVQLALQDLALPLTDAVLLQLLLQAGDLQLCLQHGDCLLLHAHLTRSTISLNGQVPDSSLHTGVQREGMESRVSVATNKLAVFENSHSRSRSRLGPEASARLLTSASSLSISLATSEAGLLRPLGQPLSSSAWALWCWTGAGPACAGPAGTGSCTRPLASAESGR